MKTPSEFARDWYKPYDIKRSIASGSVPMPVDVYSDAFAEWLCDQYRLAMVKGIQIGREQSNDNRCAKCQGTGVTYRHWNSDYVECDACYGKGR